MPGEGMGRRTRKRSFWLRTLLVLFSLVLLFVLVIVSVIAPT
jgi:hypothetical protein